MTRLSTKLTASAIAIAFALAGTAAQADQTAPCNDSRVGGTECGTGSNAADFATAVGFEADARAEGSVAVGSSSTASGFVAVAIGNAALASADNATAVGFLAQATGTGSTATGAGARADGLNSVASGINAGATGANTVAIGANATATAPNSVALGANSVANQADTVSVGTVGGERRIVNVAAGIADTDAVNVSQLSAVNNAMTNETAERIAGDAALGTRITNETANRTAGDAALGGRIDDLAFNLDDGLRENARDARAGTSAALAAAALPQAMDAGRSMIAGGVGTYRGRTALAVGGSHRLSSGNAIVKVGVTYDTSEHVGANAGVGFQF